MAARTRTKCCDRCGVESAVLYRVRAGEKPWLFVCNRCWPTLQAQPGYAYGGTWKARKRH
ncbi:MAG: hypothetical protein IGR92_01990 [Leptolyngbyaceae cyanobacterium T60_A2020_046]|nr:hypothetical protein [Leptolyngbyaceae cyanobacterium T60_A2020_046]